MTLMIILFNVDDHDLTHLLAHFHHFLPAELQFFYFEHFINNDVEDADDVEDDDVDDNDDDEGGDADGEELGEDDDDTCMGQH